MFNLLVMSGGWPQNQSAFRVSRIFEYTDDEISRNHKGEGGINFSKLARYPCLFMPEQNSGDNIARIGHISKVLNSSRADIVIEYSFDAGVPPVPVDWIAGLARDLNMDDWEFARTHWAVKDVDLYRVFLRSLTPRRNRPTVFNLNEMVTIDPLQMSAMMPFDASFGEVYRTIQRAGSALGMKVNRADDFWEHHQIIQDIVTLIDRSRIIIADCTGKNPNVFYEIGVAHSIGREVIIITQSIDFVPFDLRHLRVIQYLNNGEGLSKLEMALRDRASTLLGSA